MSKFLKKLLPKSTKSRHTVEKKGKMDHGKDEHHHHTHKEEMCHEKFPETLEEFDYSFVDGVLKHRETNEQYQFNAKHNDHKYNQMRYEALGEAVTKHIYDLMEEETKLKRVYVPVDAPPEEPRSFIFVSENWKTADRLLILIHGSGAVRAGQWSRKLIINSCIDHGSQLPFIRRAIEDKFGIVVMNPNLNAVDIQGEKIFIRGNKSPEEHGRYVWDNFISKCQSKNIAIVAHSFGGVVTLNLLKTFTDDFISRVFAIAFTDSVHSCGRKTSSREVIQLIKHRAINFASCYDPINTPLEQYSRDDCMSVSAGTEQHELTSWSSFELVFTFIKTKLHDWLSPPKDRTSVDALQTNLDTLSLDRDNKIEEDREGNTDKDVPDKDVPDKDGSRDGTVEGEERKAEVKQLGDTAEVKQLGDTAEVKQIGDTAEVKQLGDTAEVKQLGDTAEVQQLGDTAEVQQLGDTAEVKQSADSETGKVYQDDPEKDGVDGLKPTDDSETSSEKKMSANKKTGDHVEAHIAGENAVIDQTDSSNSNTDMKTEL